MRQRSQAERPRQTQRKREPLGLQQQQTRSQTKNKYRETCRLQDKGAQALHFLRIRMRRQRKISYFCLFSTRKGSLRRSPPHPTQKNKILSGIFVTWTSAMPVCVCLWSAFSTCFCRFQQNSWGNYRRTITSSRLVLDFKTNCHWCSFFSYSKIGREARAFFSGPSSSRNRAIFACVKSSQVNTLPKAKSQAKDKRAKGRQKYAALRCKC